MGDKERYHSGEIMGKGLWNITKFGKKGRYRIRKIERERGVMVVSCRLKGNMGRVREILSWVIEREGMLGVVILFKRDTLGELCVSG